MHAYVKDIMTTKVVAVSPGTAYQELTAMLREHRVSGFPVIDDAGTVIGVVSEGDLLAKEALEADLGAHPDRLARLPRRRRTKAGGLTAADLMTRPAVTTSPHELASAAAMVMSVRKIRRLPVVDHGHLVGIISRADVLSVFARPDSEIRREVTQDVLLDGFFIDPARLEVTVQDGIVTLAGAPGSVVLGINIVDQVRHVEGVVAVRDQFSYPQPSAHQVARSEGDQRL